MRNSTVDCVGAERLIESSTGETRRAACHALRSMTVSCRAGFGEHFLALFKYVRQILCSGKGRDKKQKKEDSFHFDPSGIANTTNVEPRRKFSFGNSAAAAPPTTVWCHPLVAAMYRSEERRVGKEGRA